MPINFTDSPANGATITNGDSTFIYNSTYGVWDRVISTSPISTYSTLADMPLSDIEDDTLAKILDTNKLYKWTGTGWYFLDPVNTNPTITTGGDSSYELATNGTPTVVTLQANDPEGFPIIWSYAVTAGSLGSTATVSQSNNVFTITPSTSSANAGSFTLTFTASDGVNLATSASGFSLAFAITKRLWRLYIDASPSIANNIWDIDPDSTTGLFSSSGTRLTGALTPNHGSTISAGTYGIFESANVNPFNNPSKSSGFTVLTGSGNFLNTERVVWPALSGHWVYMYFNQETNLQGSIAAFRTFTGDRPDRIPVTMRLQYYNGALSAGAYVASSWVTLATLSNTAQNIGNPHYRNITLGSTIIAST